MGGRTCAVGFLATLASVAVVAGCGGGSAKTPDGGLDTRADTTTGGACSGVWVRASSAQSPPGVWHAAMAPDLDRGEVLLYGGILADPQGRTDAAWSWNGTTGTWTNRTPTPRPASWPPALSDHRMVWDPVRHRILMFGGNDPDLNATADLWEWNGAAGTWTKLTPTPRPAAWPPARESPGMTYDAGRGRLIVASGYTPLTSPGVADDVWEWNSADGKWTDRTPDPRPAAWYDARQDPSMGMDPSSGRAVLLGGFSGGAALKNEMWEWNPDTVTWTDLKARPHSDAWPPGGGWAAVIDGVCPGKLVAVGSDLMVTDVAEPDLDFVRIWRWDGSASEWVDLTPSPRPAAWPPVGQTPAAALDPATGRIVFFGGQPRPGMVPNAETWTWGP